jgi:hypothetical protein
MKQQGPNVKKLIVAKMSTDAVPKGGGLQDAINFLSTKESIIAGARKATEWVEAAILAVRAAAEPNPWKDASDEDIAAEILKGVEARRKKP